MRLFLACKRHYTNRDLLSDHYGRLYHLPLQLAALGHQVQVVAADYKGTDSSRLEFDNLTFDSHPVSPSSLARFVRYIHRAAREFEPDLLIASADTYLGVLGSYLANRNEVPFVFDVYDDYRRFKSARIPGMRSAFNWILRSADLVVCASEKLEEVVNTHNSSTCVVHNGVDRSLFTPVDKLEARRALALRDDEPIIGYFGSIAPKRGVDVLIQAISKLRSSDIPARLLLAGKKDAPLNLDVGWIDYRGFVPQEDVPMLMGACDVVVVPYLSDPQIDVSNASKLPEYLACEVPVVSTRVSNYADLFGLPAEATCEPNDEADLARAIRFQLERRHIVVLPDEFEWRSLALRLEGALGRTLAASG